VRLLSPSQFVATFWLCEQRHESHIFVIPALRLARMAVKRVVVIGLGPGGAIAIDALAQEKVFDTIRVFERREAPGGCW
jgi:ribulose 1,5-bisphosphate synthetase/thiazole synthase